MSSLSKDAITEVKSFKQPPDPVVLVLNAVCVLKGEKLGWDNSLKMLSKNDFRDSLINYPRDRIPAAVCRSCLTEWNVFLPCIMSCFFFWGGARGLYFFRH